MLQVVVLGTPLAVEQRTGSALALTIAASYGVTASPTVTKAFASVGR
jgi:hypothetical protein